MDPLPLLQDLVRIPSVNPMGRDLTGPEYFETRVTAYLAEFFTSLGVRYETQEIAPGRANIVARIDAPEAQGTIVLDAHQDTVPVDGMTIPPFEPTLDGNRLYGRGACDVKGGLAVMLAAFARLSQRPQSLRWNVAMCCTADEEYQAFGVNTLVRSWSATPPANACSLLREKPLAAIIAEPTDLDLVVAHRGATRWKIVTHGRACHSSEPQLGVNAIYRMARIVSALQEFAAVLPTQRPPHPLCGGSTLSVGRIQGGQSVNVVPDRCEIEIDRRVIPGEDSIAVMEELRQYLATKVDFEFQMLPPWIVGLPLGDGENGALAESLLATITAKVGPRKTIGVPYGTNASRYAAAGVPAVVFGPGSIRQAHTMDEWVPVDELRQAANILESYLTA